MRLLVVGIFAALSIGAATPFMPRTALLNGIADDTFYYLQIARNLTHGRGFTFDGLHRTNGFHPLWLFCISPIARFAPSDLASVRLVVLLQLLIVVLASVDLFRTLAPRTGSWPALTTVMLLVALPSTQLMLLSGMESALILWLLIRVWRCWLGLTESGEDPAPAQWLTLGVWCSLAFLARLEAGIVTPVLALLAFRYWRHRAKVLFAIVAVPMATAAAYLVWNQLMFHVWIPISGIVKGSFGFLGPMTAMERLLVSYSPLSRLIESTGLDRSAPYAAFLIYCGVLLLLTVICVVYRRVIWCRMNAARVVAAVAICAAIWLLENVFLPFGASWYPVGPALATALIGGALVAPDVRLARMAAIALVALGLGRSALHVWRDLRIRDSLASTWEAAEWARDHIPANERIGSWNAGAFAYASHRQVINLDGLVNDVDFYREVIVQKGLAQYIARERIEWLADGVFSADSTLRPRYGLTTDQATMPMTLAYRACQSQQGACTGFAIWKLAAR